MRLNARDELFEDPPLAMIGPGVPLVSLGSLGMTQCASAADLLPAYGANIQLRNHESSLGTKKSA